MKIITKLFLLFTLFIAVTGCVDNDFDEPTGGIIIDDSKVVTIKSIMDSLEGNDVVTFSQDSYLKAIVTADDESGNFYKQLVFADNTGALSIAVDQNSLSAAHPIGSVIYIQLNGLILASNNGTPQLGAALEKNTVQRIPDAVVAKHLIPGGLGEAIQPEVVKLEDLKNGDQYLNKLITIEKVEFAPQYVGATYASPETTTGQRAENRIITACGSDELIVRNSDFSTFAALPLPTGNGTITGIFSRYRSDYQLFVRDTFDLKMTGKRCDGGGDQAKNEITLASIKAPYYEKGADKIPEGYISGVVISSKASKNYPGKNLYLQNGTDGIAIRFAANHNFSLGEKLHITVTGLQLSEFKNLLQINNVPVINAVSKGKSDLPAPKVLTVKELKADLASEYPKHVSTRVTIKNAKLPAGKKYGDRISLNDGTGSLQIYTSKFAKFVKESVKTGTVEVTGIFSQYDKNGQILLNSTDDIVGGSVDPGDGGDPGNDNTELKISAIKASFYDSQASTVGKGFVKGIVISDKNTGQMNGKNIFLQNGSDGIVVRFKDNHDLEIGDEVKIKVSGGTLGEFNALLQISDIANANVEKIGSATLPDPVELTVETLKANANKYESVRILIKNASLSSSSGNYDGSVSIDDGSGKINTFIGSRANFKGEALPSGKVSVLGIGSAYNDPQVFINSNSDVK